jgi:hypothetical protein
MDEQLLERYLPGAGGERESRWVSIPRRVYFAGDSRRWGGPVAFLSLRQPVGAVAYCRAFGVDEHELATVFRQENGLGELPTPLHDLAMEPGGWRQVLMPKDPDDRRGKYNVLLRLDDIDGRPAYTFTTNRSLAVGPPTDRYLDSLLSGVREAVDSSEVLAYQEGLRSSCCADNRDHIDAHVRSVWAGSMERGGLTGFPVVQLPAKLEPAEGPRLYLGRAGAGGTWIGTWVAFTLEGDRAPLAASEVFRALPGEDGGRKRVTVELLPAAYLTREAGLLSRIPDSDVLLVAPEEAARLGRWAVAVTPHFSGPVRIRGDGETDPGRVRVAYAARSLLGLSRSDPVVLQALPPARTSPGGSLRRLLRRLLRGAGEWAFGAPPVALRATEGLVGDDGRTVARVDSTALDFLGMSAGDKAVLSWADRSTRVRLLLQTPETKECMDAQLSESTGRQARTTLTDIASRTVTPEHLRIWVSSTTRVQLGIPPDTLVRVRRSLADLLLRHASTAAVPAAGLIIAALAVPSVAWWVWVVASLFVLLLVLIPIRRK